MSCGLWRLCWRSVWVLMSQRVLMEANRCCDFSLYPSLFSIYLSRLVFFSWRSNVHHGDNIGSIFLMTGTHIYSNIRFMVSNISYFFVLTVISLQTQSVITSNRLTYSTQNYCCKFWPHLERFCGTLQISKTTKVLSCKKWFCLSIQFKKEIW